MVLDGPAAAQLCSLLQISLPSGGTSAVALHGAWEGSAKRENVLALHASDPELPGRLRAAVALAPSPGAALRAAAKVLQAQQRFRAVRQAHLDLDLDPPLEPPRRAGPEAAEGAAAPALGGLRGRPGGRQGALGRRLLAAPERPGAESQAAAAGRRGGAPGGGDPAEVQARGSEGAMKV